MMFTIMSGFVMIRPHEMPRSSPWAFSSLFTVAVCILLTLFLFLNSYTRLYVLFVCLRDIASISTYNHDL